MPVMPASIDIWDVDKPYVDELDFEYVDGAAADAAAILAGGGVAELAYQPGDGTFYGLVIVPLSILEYARPRVKDGWAWDRHAVRGMKDRDGDDGGSGASFYGTNGFLVCWVENGCYPLRLRNRDKLAVTYVMEHWKTTSRTSATSITLLLRAIAKHLDGVA